MSRLRITAFVVAALAIVALALTGCFTPTTVQQSSSSSQIATPQVSVEPTQQVKLKTDGPITTPKTGSADRQALLDAARAKLGVTTSFYVYQLFVQGDTAIGDLDPVSATKNGRVFVAWEKRDGQWVAIGASKYGSKAANAATTARALPSFSTELIAKVDWTYRKPAAKPSNNALSAAEAKTKLETSAKEWAKSTMSGQGAPYTVPSIWVAQDAKGAWWGRAIVAPTGEFERIEFWAKYEAGGWNGTAQDPEPPAASTYFPKALVSKLGF